MAVESDTAADPATEAWGILYSPIDKDYPIQYLTGVKESFSKSGASHGERRNSESGRRNSESGRRNSESGRRNRLTKTTNGSRMSKLMPRNRHSRLFKIKMVEGDEENDDKIVVVSKAKQGLSVDGKAVGDGSESIVENGRCSIRVEDLELELVFEAFYETTKRTTLTELEGYRIMSVLGKGAYGIVYKAFKVADESFCVVKASINMELDDLANEYKCLKELDHPAILTALAFHRSSYVTFLVTELAHGGSLYRRIKERGRMTEAAAGRAIRQIARALLYLHDSGLVHRDVKPQNVVLMSNAEEEEEEERWKLIDFGLCCRDDDRKAMRMIAGATRYMPPEMLRKEITGEASPVSNKIDVWGLGVCFFTALTRRDPFKYSHDKSQFMQSMLANELRTELKGYDACSARTKALVLGCLQPDPSKRLSARQLTSLWDAGTAPSSSSRTGINEGAHKTVLRS